MVTIRKLAPAGILGALTSIAFVGCVGNVGDSGAGDIGGPTDSVGATTPAQSSPGAGKAQGQSSANGTPVAANGMPGTSNGTPSVPGTPPSNTTNPAPSVPGAPPVPSPPGVVPLRRLNRAELANSLSEIFGVNETASFVSEKDNGFRQGDFITTTEFDALLDGMERLATTVAERLPMLLACDVAKRGEATCADEVIATFGRRLFRHTLSATEAADLKAVYTDARAAALGYDHKEALRTTILAMLLSPRLHYHNELGD